MIGNSVGAALALKSAASSPNVKQVLAIGAPAGPPAPPALRAFWTAPHDAAALATAMRPMTGAARLPDPALVEARMQWFQDSDYGRYFDAMLTVVLERNVPRPPYVATDQTNHGARTQAPAAAAAAVIRANPPSQRLPKPTASHAAARTTT